MIKNCGKCKQDFKTRDSTRKYCSKSCYVQSQIGRKQLKDISGCNNPNWRGGRRPDKDGYILVYEPSHPYKNCDRRVREHRLVMEKHLNRYLLPDEVVHHINEVRDDNRIENLQVMDKKKHDLIHIDNLVNQGERIK